MKLIRFFLIFALFFLMTVAACDSGTCLTGVDDSQSVDGGEVTDGTSGSEAVPPTYYPHGDDWKKGINHGIAYKAAGEELCISCHELREEAPTCASCHASYPHTDSRWMAKPTPKHAIAYIHKVKAGKENDCTMCHGTDYGHVMDGISCTTIGCHENGVTHTPDWATGERHGFYFSDRYTATDSDAKCFTCHGEPIPFTTTQRSKRDLVPASDCYQCHQAYPHIAYDRGTSSDVWTTGLTSGGLAHVDYLLRSPLLVDTAGIHPTNVSDNTDPRVPNAVKSTCGSATGSSTVGCHVDGNRAGALPTSTNLCKVCHQK